MVFDYTAVDVETANPARGSICQIGLVRVRSGIPVLSMSTLLRPEPSLDRFEPMNVRVHGIESGDVQAAPRWTEVLDQMRGFIGQDLLVAHNAPFERSAFRQVAEATGTPVLGAEALCTVNLARAVLPHLRKHRLPVVLAELGRLPGNHHDALADAVDSAVILQGCAALVGAQSLTELVSRTGVQPIPIPAG